MSKVGKKTISIPESVKIEYHENIFKAVGPKGELSLTIPQNIRLKIFDREIAVERINDDKKNKSFHGLYRKLISNSIIGVSEGFVKKLDFKGVGFKAEVGNNNNLVLNVGFSHPVEIKAPEGIEFKVEKNIITVSGINLQQVGEIAAKIRQVKPVEPYKGKGIKYLDEIPRRKPGKTAKAVIGAGA
jgi:large subunit ribosomal protein L6